ncbi:hypothetical protein F1880_008717 [Penicillium rolfsii]|nr:hypothetical protein F1880_008717 [Penicillium rolfsii]
MQFKTASASVLFAGLATASSFTTAPYASFTPSSPTFTVSPSSLPPSSVIAGRVSHIPSASLSSLYAASSSASAAALNSSEYDCVYQGRGCDWTKSEYGYGSDYCGSSPYQAGQRLSDGSLILAVSKDGSRDCASKAGAQCCKVLADNPCKYGEKYLECYKP